MSTMAKPKTCWERLQNTAPPPEIPPVDKQMRAPCDHSEEKQRFSHNYRAACQCGAVNICGDWV